MARIFITGSADGLGMMAARQLVNEGHEVVLHGRNQNRANQALEKVPGAIAALGGDLSDIEDTKHLALKANELGNFDAVIHNAGVYQASGELKVKVNTLAPYILTCLMTRPDRLIYLSSGLHQGGSPNLNGLENDWNKVSYSDTKLHNVMMAKIVERKWSGVYANAVNPGWVPTKMGGPGATDDLDKGYETQVWLASSQDEEAKVSGNYYFHRRPRKYNSKADSITDQEAFLKICYKLTAVEFTF